MSQEGSEQDMRPEYDIRGGVRGKYFDRYRDRASISVAFTGSPLIAESTASAQVITVVTLPASYPVPLPSPKIEIGQPVPVGSAG